MALKWSPQPLMTYLKRILALACDLKDTLRTFILRAANFAFDIRLATDIRFQEVATCEDVHCY